MTQMDELHKGLLIKLYINIAGVDRTWTESEEHLANVLFYHVWHRKLNKSDLRESIRHVESKSQQMSWYSLVRPFAQFAPLRNAIPELETAVIRIGNLIAKADGQPTSLEIDELKSAQRAILDGLHVGEDADGSRDSGSQRFKIQTAEEFKLQDDELEVLDEHDASESAQRKPTLEEALAELDELIGFRKSQTGCANVDQLSDGAEASERNGFAPD